MLGAGAAAVALLAGCGSSNGSAASSSTTVPSGSAATGGAATGGAAVATAQAAVAKYLEKPTKITQTEPLTGKVEQGRTYVVIGCELPQCKTISDGAIEAAKAIGWKPQYLSYKTTDGATLTAAVKQALDYKPIAVSPIGYSQTAWDQLQPAYRAAKVPLVPIAVGDAKPSDIVTVGSSTQTDYAAAGELLANWFIADSGGKGTAVVQDVPAFAVLKAYGDAFKAKVAADCPGCSLSSIDIAPAQLATNGLVPAVVSELQKHPKAGYLVTTDGAFVASLPSALKAAGLTKIKIAGGAADINNTQALVSGTQAAWTLEPTDQFGWTAVDIAARTLLGMKVDPASELRPMMLATKANIGTPANFLDAPSDYRQQYQKLWGVA